jgi:hypothetical protein
MASNLSVFDANSASVQAQVRLIFPTTLQFFIKILHIQINPNYATNELGTNKLFFQAVIPPLGYAVYFIYAGYPAKNFLWYLILLTL